MTEISRFNHNIDSKNHHLVHEYYYLRTKQLLSIGFSPSYEIAPIIYDNKTVGVVYRNSAPEHNKYVSLYIFRDHRNKGYYKRYIQENPGTTIFTIEDCGIDSFLDHRINKNDYVILNGFFNLGAYDFISEVYGNIKAKRSKQYYMNHIDEGCFILSKLGFNHYTNFKMFEAFMVHPIFQEDKNLMTHGLEHWQVGRISHNSLLLAMEYRHIANAHLPKHPIKKPEEIELGPLPEIKSMLIADKIQNCKDLEFYNKNHPNYDRLHHYFHKEWFPRLGVTEEFYRECVQSIERQ